jgi:hypothetical protein
MALLTPNAGDKTHSAGVVFVRRVIKTLSRRQTVLCLPKLQRDFPRGVQDRTTIAVYLFGTSINGQSTIQNFDSADGNFAKFPDRLLWLRRKRICAIGRNFFDLSHRKSESECDSGSGILSFRYVAHDPDNVVDAHPHNGHTNYCLAWALSES